ncbi:hypothetical protein PpBr36_09107 [Pyricularia pennisetigena]|uniref:hypothetical protein n=1 Tax=Pyricularia pennisetigena TaxID=1578925 RepID=UPI0011515CFB|nr:hypothetical protein PpBr36_09107 [Pyricularia pennisetigena]TLS23908.1 hypothetical protein PpBr36_09107 [Pyricularia pennisetigena]
MTSPDSNPRAALPAGSESVTVKIINPVNFGPAVLNRFMAPPVPGFEKLPTLPSFSFLIEHPPSGRKLVFDLGIRKDFETGYSRKISEYIPTTNYDIRVEKDVVEILEEGGVDPRGIEAVIWSHWHWDHIGNPQSFPETTDLIVGPGFKEAMLPGAPSNPESPIQESDYANRNLREITFDGPQALKIGNFPAYDYFGDGSFYLLNSPGHAIGHLCGLARTTTSPTSTFVLLGGDVCHYAGIFRPSPQQPIPASITPHPCASSPLPALCPGHAWEELQRSRGGRARTDALFDMTFGHDVPLATGTMRWLQELDCIDDVFVIIAHDATVRDGGVPRFPASLNDWKANGWGRDLKWAFLRDLESFWRSKGVNISSVSIMSAFQEANKDLDYDVLVIGAGLSGIYSLHHIRELGLRVKVLEAAEAAGGTWFWNRYPGARFDSESVSYIFSFSQEVLEEWSWTEHFASQPETLKYVNYLVDKFDLKRSMQFNTRITSMKFRNDSNSWLLVDQNGREYTTRYVVTAIGILNEPTLPAIPGVEDYKGEAWHTARWPGDHEVAFRGKRVGIIGTGATGIQTVQEIYKHCGSLTVFQRTPNWTAPIRNSKISPEEMKEIRKRYPEIFQACLESGSCFIHKVNPKKTTEWDREELLAHFEELYLKPGFAKVLGIPVDIFMDREANKLYSDFIASKIRPRIKDPAVAEKLIPKCHGFMTRRVPLEDGYYEAFNEPHVRLVDLKETPIERITEKGVLIAAPATNGSGDQPKPEEIELDVLIYATGFDATTGSFRAIDIQGVDGKRLWEDTWANRISTYLGVTVPKFPNMFMSMGPHQSFGNIPRSIEYTCQWIVDLIKFARDRNLLRVEATQEKADAWYNHVESCGVGMLINEVDSWMTGVNTNLKHKQKRSLVRYNGPAPGYRKICNEVKAKEYQDFELVFGN